MKVSLGGKWEVDVGRSNISKELEDEIKRAAKLAAQIDKKVEDTVYGNVTTGGHSGPSENKRNLSEGE